MPGGSTPRGCRRNWRCEGAALLLETLEALEAGRARAEPQPVEGAPTPRKLDKREARIDWNQSAIAIERQVRAFNPWPVAETLWRDQRVRLWEAHSTQARVPAQPALAAAAGAVPGDVLGITDDGVEVLCGQGVLAVTRLQLEGRRALPAREFIRGQPLLGRSFHLSTCFGCGGRSARRGGPRAAARSPWTAAAPTMPSNSSPSVRHCAPA